MTQLSLEHNNLLRGIAIIAVVTIHFFAGFPGIYSASSPNSWLYVAIDQLSRFSVPLFIALSGYGFWHKFQDKPISYFSYIKRQATKLLPLYLVVSIISYTIFIFIPHWRVAGTPDSLAIQLITGRADYHLYFVPMIFQFYILFPLLRAIVRKFRWSSLIISAIFQLFLYQLLSNPPSFLATDQQQYIWFFSWIFYFILGMHLSSITRSPKITTFITAIILISSSISLIKQGIDPIVALRFTSIPVFLFATTTILTLTTSVPKLKSNKLTNIIAKIGASSYPIYLFHTLILRTFFEIFVY